MLIEDQGIILHLMPFQDRSFIIKVFSEKNGYIKSLAYKKKVILNIGNKINFKIRRKSIEQLGTINITDINNISVEIFFNSWKIGKLNNIFNLLDKTLPYEESNTTLFAELEKIIHIFANNNDQLICLKQYVKFKLIFLTEMGFGLKLDSCPIFKNIYELKYISPKTGQSISARAGVNYHDKLFIMPKFFQNLPTDHDDLQQCLKILDFFINKYIVKTSY